MRTIPRAMALRRELGSINVLNPGPLKVEMKWMLEGYEYAYLVSLTELKDLCYPKTLEPVPEDDGWFTGPRGGKYQLVNGRKVYTRS